MSLAAFLLLLASAAETVFEASPERLADAAACEARLERLAEKARQADHDAVELG